MVEVVSSLGIVSFGLVALLGLLPMGLQVTRDARESTAEAQINQYLSNLARQTAPDRMKDIVSPRVFYFDCQGLEVDRDSADKFYEASLSTGSTAGTALPADVEYVSASLSTVQVTLKKCHGHADARVTSLHCVMAGR